MGAEDVYLTEAVEQSAHLLVGDLPFSLQRGGRPTADEAKAEPLYVPRLPVHILVVGWQCPLQRTGAIDIAVDHKSMPTLEGLRHTCVLCIDCLTDGGPDLIDAVANGVQPETSHLLIVACATCCSRRPCELHAHDVRNRSLTRPVVGEIHQVAEDEQCLPCGHDSPQRLRCEVDVRQDQHRTQTRCVRRTTPKEPRPPPRRRR